MLRDGLLQPLMTDRRVQGGHLRSLERLEDAPLRKDREALVEPEVLRGRVRHEVAGPRVSELVREDVDEAAVAREQGRREEREPRVLHPAVRERRRHDEQVEAIPVVGSEERLGRAEVILDLFELPRGGLELRRLRPHARAR